MVREQFFSSKMSYPVMGWCRVDRWLVAGGFFVIAISIFIIAPLPLDGSWLYYWELGLDPWFTVFLSISTILLGILLVGFGLKGQRPSGSQVDDEE